MILICYQGPQICVIFLISISILQVHLQVVQVLFVTVPHVPSQNCEENVLVVCASSQLLEKLDMAMLRPLQDIIIVTCYIQCDITY